MNAPLHRSHPGIVKRLRRAEGQLRGIVEMIEGERPCLDIAQQLHAVEKAIAEAKRTLVQDHVDHCLEAAAGASGSAQRRILDEFKAIVRYL